MKENFNNSDNDNANWHDNINYIGGVIWWFFLNIPQHLHY